MAEKPFWRLLRTFEHVASQTYECKLCHKDIYEGETYQGEVWVSIEHLIVTERLHIFCDFDDPEDDEDWNKFEDKDVIPDISPSPLPLPKAA